MEDIVGTGLAEDTVPEVDRDSEKGIYLQRDTGQLVDRKGPRKGVDLRTEAGRTFCAFEGDIRC